MEINSALRLGFRDLQGVRKSLAERGVEFSYEGGGLLLIDPSDYDIRTVIDTLNDIGYGFVVTPNQLQNSSFGLVGHNYLTVQKVGNALRVFYRGRA